MADLRACDPSGRAKIVILHSTTVRRKDGREMAKKDMKVAPTVETLKPYLDRALNDKEFRDDLKEALAAAKTLYGPLVKDARGKDGAAKSATRLATDAKVQENLRK